MKKLRRKETSSDEVANVYLEQEYLPEHNEKFARAAAKSEDYHRHGSMAIEYRGRALRWQEIAAPARPKVLRAASPSEPKRVPVSIAKRKWAPPSGHAWREAARRGLKRRALKEAAAAERPPTKTKTK